MRGLLQRTEFVDGEQPACPGCGGLLVALQEVNGRPAGGWSSWGVVLVKGEPCKCDLTGHAQRLQAEHSTKETP
jgi:hypothetical protein